MAQKEQQRGTYRSMQGREIDMNKLININELTPAVGNVRVNARGDELGPGGQIVRKREEIQAAAIAAVPDQINVRQSDVVEAAAPAKAPAKAINIKNVNDQDPEGNE